MEREVAIARLESNQASLRALGLARLSLFGSTARGEASPESDVDLAVTLDRSAASTCSASPLFPNSLAGCWG